MSLALLTLLLGIQTQSPQTPVTVEEYLELKDLGAVQVSPDGGSVAFTVTEAPFRSLLVCSRKHGQYVGRC